MDVERMIYQEKDKLYRLCLYLEKDKHRAEELYQDTWVKALEKLSTYNWEYPMYPWLTQIAVNTYRDRLRRFRCEFKRYRYTTQEELQEIPQREESTEKEYMSKESLRITMQCIGELPDKYRLPIILTAGEEMTYKEVASVLHIEEKLVKSRIYEGRQKLKSLLLKEGLDD